LITVVAVSGLVTVQDAGRPGRMHEGVPPGGPLVPELLARANAAVGNGEQEAGLEVLGTIALTGPRGTVVASDDGTAAELGGDGPWRVGGAPAGRVRYVAVRGGVDVPRVLGGRGTLLGAGLGGHEGRALRAGDVLPVGAAPPPSGLALPPRPSLDALLHVVPGPDLPRFEPGALDVLLGSAFRLDPRSDRVGIRLSGPALRRLDDDRGPSAPMVRGAIQVPVDGAPIVLGPDHPTTGGYAVLATVVRASLGSLGARPIGAVVRFATLAT
jgi:biotin-dependent carboxylase-like uncharacterized protein